MATPKAQSRYLKRQGMVEPVFGHLRERQGLNRFRRKGLSGVRLEFALHALAYNLSRAVVYGRLVKPRLPLFSALSSPLRHFSAFWEKICNRISTTSDSPGHLYAL